MSFINYRNGNYVVYFNTKTGDKIRNTHEENFIPAFAENCDVTITDRCDGACPFCYAGCTVNGRHGNLNAACLDTVPPYTELAINGNDLSHPDLIPFLKRMAARHVIVNMTVNQKHFLQHFDFIKTLKDENLIHGIGVSLVEADATFIKKLKEIPNTILHVINGVFTKENAIRLMGHNLDILILGYKTTCRGQSFLDTCNEEISKNQKWLNENIVNMMTGFKTIEFDNLALEQLSMRGKISNDIWNRHYMGEEGGFTFFVNLVDNYFAKNSTSPDHYPLMESMMEMFQFLQSVENNKNTKKEEMAIIAM